MKNVFKMMGIALVACSMFAACGDPAEEATEYTIKVKANNSDWGTVTGGGKYEEGATATLEATANAGYEFVNWDNGSTNNPLIVTVTADAEYTANFQAANGINVTFGSNSWKANYTNSRYYTNAVQVAGAQTNSSSYPMFQMVNIWQSGSPATGSYNGTSSLGDDGSVNITYPYIWYYQNQGDEITLTYQDGSTVDAGDWWGETVALNISKLDADALTIDLVVNANMRHAIEVLDGTTWSNTETSTMTVNVIGETMATNKDMMKVVKATIKK